MNSVGYSCGKDHELRIPLEGRCGATSPRVHEDEGTVMFA